MHSLIVRSVCRPFVYGTVNVWDDNARPVIAREIV